MNHPIHRVRSFEISGPYILHLTFDDASEQTIDCSPVLAGEVYGPLREMRTFESVRLDTECITLVWANGADFDPATLHDWPQHAEAFSSMRYRPRSWAQPGGSSGWAISIGVLTEHAWPITVTDRNVTGSLGQERDIWRILRLCDAH